MSSYRVALIGCGGRAKEHVAPLQADARCRVIALADIKRENAEKLNSEAGFDAAVYVNHNEMLAKERPDVVIACLWTPLHLPVFRDCVEAGVRAVLSEKPMAPTWSECLEIARLAEESGTLLTFCHQRRFTIGNLLARQLIREGRFGAIRRMELFSPPNLLDCGTHTFDQALSFNGETPAKWALGAVDTTELLHWFGVSAEGMAEGTVVFENGVRANFQIGGADQEFGSGARVHGTEGFFEVDWDGKFGRCRIYSDPAWQPPALDEAPGAPMLGVVKNALDCLESGALFSENSRRKRRLICCPLRLHFVHHFAVHHHSMVHHHVVMHHSMVHHHFVVHHFTMHHLVVHHTMMHHRALCKGGGCQYQGQGGDCRRESA